ncbi:MAG TPA: ribonuclease Y [bacterium]|nr:ribonuclease Y [bacterium]HMW33387.1 ribonuclease Y [bacterium]HMW35452.1 ribonuclease Y [bacterium]HMY36748.1 ribonuclease Y [bacterium]HMZ05625.1 ribonuclease Y [bacterium]
MDSLSVIIMCAAGIVMFILGWVFATYFGKNKVSEIRKIAENTIREAKREAETIRNEAEVKSKQRWHQIKMKIVSETDEREKRLKQYEQKLVNREREIRNKMSGTVEKEQLLQRSQKDLTTQQEQLQTRAQHVESVIHQQMEKLENITKLSYEEAKKQFLESVAQRAQKEAAELMLQMKNEATQKASFEAKWIISDAIQRLASDQTAEITLTTVDLPNEKIKGAIIGREGRNIKAFEQITGVKVIIDDTPEVLVLSSMDPVKREIARLAMLRLTETPNIQPEFIEDVVERCKKQVETAMNKASDEVLNSLNIKNVAPEMKQMLGRLKYRTSYGQNVLQHSKEVALLAGNMASELGYDVQLARRAGLFHDIGKATSNENEGSHVTIGVEVTTRCKEHEVVINSVLAHHDEAEPIHPISQLVTAADIISGSRPGARREPLEAYGARIEKLEQIAQQFDGVSKVYAIFAGREIRIVVEAEKMDDAQSAMLSSNVAQKIQNEMQYPGQIKVVVIRERRVVRYTNSTSPAVDEARIEEAVVSDSPSQN